MRRPQVILGTAILILGLLLLIGNLTGIDICAYLFPLILIGIGVWIVTRPSVIAGGKDTQIQLIGDIHRRGKWAVHDQDFLCGVGDIYLDFTEAHVPEGETRLRLYGIVNDVRLIMPEAEGVINDATLTMPETIGVSIASTSFLTSARGFGDKQDYFLTVYENESGSYASATRKIRLELFYFVVDLKIRRASIGTAG